MRCSPSIAAGAQIKTRLLTADKLQIDLRQQLRIEQGAVPGACGIVDAVAFAERVEAIRPGRMLAAGERQRVDDAVGGDRGEG